MKKLLLSILLVFVIPAQAWFWEAKTLNDYKDDFKNQVHMLEKEKEKVTVELTETKKLIFTYKSLLAKSRKDNIDFDNLLSKWEKSQTEIYNLENRFKILVQSADTYFSEIKKQTDQMSEGDFKSITLQNITKKQNKYIKRLKSTRKNLIKLTIVHKKLKDAILFLKLNFLLSSFDKEIDNRFLEIDTITNNLLTDLKMLDKESKDLLNASF